MFYFAQFCRFQSQNRQNSSYTPLFTTLIVSYTDMYLHFSYFKILIHLSCFMHKSSQNRQIARNLCPTRNSPPNKKAYQTKDKIHAVQNKIRLDGNNGDNDDLRKECRKECFASSLSNRFTRLSIYSIMFVVIRRQWRVFLSNGTLGAQTLTI